jgi:hypothetical protein
MTSFQDGNVNFAPKMYNIKSNVFLMQVIRAHGGIKVWLHSFLNLVLDVVRGKLPGHFTPGKEPTVLTELDVGWAPEQVRTG